MRNRDRRHPGTDRQVRFVGLRLATHSSFRSRSKRKDVLFPVKFGCRWPVDGSMRIVCASLGNEGGGPVGWAKPHVHCISCPGATWSVERCLSGRASELSSFTGPETELRVFPANATATAFPPAQSVARGHTPFCLQFQDWAGNQTGCARPVERPAEFQPRLTCNIGRCVEVADTENTAPRGPEGTGQMKRRGKVGAPRQ